LSNEGLNGETRRAWKNRRDRRKLRARTLNACAVLRNLGARTEMKMQRQEENNHHDRRTDYATSVVRMFHRRHKHRATLINGLSDVNERRAKPVVDLPVLDISDTNRSILAALTESDEPKFMLDDFKTESTAN